MNDFQIEETKKTPQIRFDVKNGVLEISGKSIPENAMALYQPFMTWLDEYLKEVKEPKIRIVSKLEYFNTSSSKCLAEIFKKFEAVYQSETESVLLEWYYEEDDEGMIESGEDYQDMLKFPIKFLQLD